MRSMIGAALLATGYARMCDDAPLKGSVLCDETKTTTERAKWIVSQLEVGEKLDLVGNVAKPIPRMGISHYDWWNEALHGLGSAHGVSFTPEYPCATSFPQVITTGATFNKSLWNSIGRVVSDEARAMNNVGHAGLTFWAPNINLIRDPRWGRGHETPGEDPFATAEYAAKLVSGFQVGEDPKHIKASSCCKHYYAYDLEDWGGKTRHTFNAIVNPQDEADTYLPTFYSCVVNGNASGMMCSYNEVNGVPSCANERIMNGLARGDWGFEGYITSDCGAVKNVDETHHYADANATCKDVLQAGMDSDCGGFLRANLNNSMKAGQAKITDVDNALVNLFSVQIRLGMFDSAENQPYLTYTYKGKVNTPANQKLALEAAQQGMVLLKNTNNAFPLSTSTVKKVAVIGPNANATTTMQGNYAGIAPYLISPIMGISKYAEVNYVEGCNITCTSTDGFKSAAAAASDADATVLIIGISTKQESEAHDRMDISLPGYQEDLVNTIAAASKGPLIVVVMAGGSVDFSVAKVNPKVEGVMWTGYPGQSGGQAIADVIFGTYNPAGRLPHTQYPKDYITNLSMLDMGMRPNASNNNTGRTYRFYTGEAVYPYGSGMSYTTFSYSSSVSSISISKSDLSAAAAEMTSKHQYSFNSEMVSNPLATVSIKVKNTGSRDGSDVVMVFAKSPTPGQDGKPLKSLIGFERVFLNIGEEKTVSFPVPASSVALADSTGAWTAVGGEWKFVVGAADELVIPMNIA
eukprot:TRINITY_DN2042_c0_g1_i8.p1 TRINITY_DN2042_c0_g1~~TRINITY_DN2042_c0_g1_i8.p1  ORF type:complete len:748 (+),score=167.28 TRINITY_DN2042_c0_g1_i8:56-2299(+)